MSALNHMEAVPIVFRSSPVFRGTDGFRRLIRLDRAVFAVGMAVSLIVAAWLVLGTQTRAREVVVILAHTASVTLKEGAAFASVQFVRAVPSAAALSSLFTELDYRLDDVREGAAVPRVIIDRIPADFEAMDSPEERKLLFAKTVLPIVLETNMSILKDRARLEELYDKDASGKALDARERAWLERLAGRFEMDGVNLAELRRRVDAVPPSLAIAQAALESGWGTSRLAQQGHSLFGQKVQRPDAGAAVRAGIAPAIPGGDDLIMRTFDSLPSTVKAYIHNLNTHPAYREFRERRADARARGKALDGWYLAGYIKRYSERGRDYIKDVRGLIKTNDLGALDDARFSSGPPWPPAGLKTTLGLI